MQRPAASEASTRILRTQVQPFEENRGKERKEFSERQSMILWHLYLSPEVRKELFSTLFMITSTMAKAVWSIQATTIPTTKNL